MSIQILGGLAKNRSLFVPKGNFVRPTSVRLKRRIFDSRQDWQGHCFVDLCAGSGSIGIEAWSRGADEVILVEASKKVSSIIKKNIQMIKDSFKEDFVKRPISLFGAKLPSYIELFKSYYEKWPLEKKKDCALFFDPPYHDHLLYKKTLVKIFENDWFLGELWVESDEQKGLKKEELFALYGIADKVYDQGTSYIAVFDF